MRQKRAGWRGEVVGAETPQPGVSRAGPTEETTLVLLTVGF